MAVGYRDIGVYAPPGRRPDLGVYQHAHVAGAWTCLGHTAEDSTDANAVTTPALDTTGADLIVIAVASYVGSTAPTLSDSKGNVWRPATEYTQGSNSRLRLFYCVNPIAGTGHTFSASGSSSYPSLAVAAFAADPGVAFFALDQENGAGTADADALQPGSVTPTEDNELIITALTNNNIDDPAIVDTGLTITDAGVRTSSFAMNVNMAYLAQGTAAPINPTWYVGQYSANLAVIATFKVRLATSILLLDPGSSATYGTHLWATSAGIASSATGPHAGTRSLQSDSGYFQAEILNDVGRRVSFYYWIDDLPGSTSDIIHVYDAGTFDAWILRITSGGVLQLWSQNAQVGSNGPTLSADTWYRISVAYTMASATVNEFRVWVNGTLAISVSNATFQHNAGYYLRFPALFPSVTRWSHIYVDDDTGLTDPGDVRVTAKLPASVNDNNWSAGGTGAVNERALSETNYVTRAASAQAAQSYTLEAAAVGDVDISGATILGRLAWVWAKGSAGGPGAKLIDHGDSNTGITLTTSPALYTRVVTSAIYPSDAAGIGMLSDADEDTYLYECGAVIAYLAATSDPTLTWLRHRV